MKILLQLKVFPLMISIIGWKCIERVYMVMGLWVPPDVSIIEFYPFCNIQCRLGTFRGFGIEVVYDFAAPGGAELLFAPEPDPRLKFVEASLETPRGRAECAWRFEGPEKLLWHVAAPPNTVMHLRLPANWRCADFSATLPCGARDFELSPALP